MLTQINPHPVAATRALMRAPGLLLICTLLLAACSKPVEKVEDIRPVRVVVLNPANADVTSEFPGAVQARYESQLGFRVAGKIIARQVDVGTVVKRGQVLMRLDPKDLQLAQAQAVAALSSATSNRDTARADLKRYQELRDKNFVSQAVLDAKETAFKAAQATYDQAEAAFKGQSNQTAYATLESDVDGVVTAINAEAGQVVAAGTPVVSVARQGAKEVVVGVPENQVDKLRGSHDVQVRLWADPKQVIQGTVREVSPIADPATRTYAIKIAIPDDTPNVKLGMTAYASFISKTSDDAIKVPLTALLRVQDHSAVWVVEGGAVRQVAVQITGQHGNEVWIQGALRGGQQVVTAGVNQLKPGQKVTILNAPEGSLPAPKGALNQSLASNADSVATAAGGAAR
ncbi:RND family efflux transporter, MFP subunit [Collimonas sp. OK242]|uniref:efflux RND transporter periplasmic adaptor subunit n=1 Tax=Collimonas sp. OK242 TaxID=1798195 RepID=UPI00089B600E|nr:efflux RND transporter periplasmic adaptor subunit [Collimonas sp. OK242]SDX13941.1 RND family efflux transporter, MFP subunit [Collimonas sp. OK242]